MQNLSLIIGTFVMLNNFVYTGSNTENLIWLFTYNLSFSIIGTIISIIAIIKSKKEKISIRSKIGLALCSASLLYYTIIFALIYMVKDI